MMCDCVANRCSPYLQAAQQLERELRSALQQDPAATRPGAAANGASPALQQDAAANGAARGQATQNADAAAAGAEAARLLEVAQSSGRAAAAEHELRVRLPFHHSTRFSRGLTGTVGVSTSLGCVAFLSSNRPPRCERYP